MNISIIVPVYNAEKTLHTCLDSLLNQTVSEYEVICVDDGSCDSSLAILHSYQEKYHNLIVLHKTNGGQASARNLGLRSATGDYVGFVDSDDWIDLDMYEQMLETAESTQTNIVVCDMVEHFASHEVYHNFTAHSYPFAQAGSACNKLFLRSILSDIPFPLGRWYEDFNFTTKILLKTNNLSYIKKGFYHYAYNENSTMHNDNTLKNLDMLYIFKDIMNYATSHDYVSNHYKDLAYLYVDHVYITTINRIAAQKSCHRKEVISQLTAYGKEQFPNVFSLSFVSTMSKNRRIIAKLNARNHWRITSLLLHIKKVV